ncbi:MAG: tetratricopeptide (TPR) repeat protein [Candidatus Azotimanducaceae bacterium]|jgi:tetratricopeptide (TPR) repeat protein
MNKTLNFLTILAVTLLLGLPIQSYGSGGGGGGGNMGAIPSTPRLTPLEQALKYYNQGLKLRDKAWKFEKRAAESTKEKDIAKFKKKTRKEFTKAKKKFARAIRKEPRLYQAYSSLGYAHRKLGEYEDSLAAYDEALRLNVKYSEAIEYRAEAYLALGRYEDTKKAYMVLFSGDRPKADELMTAMLKWQGNLKQKTDDQHAFSAWIEERNQLSLQTAGLSSPMVNNWQD